MWWRAMAAAFVCFAASAFISTSNAQRPAVDPLGRAYKFDTRYVCDSSAWKERYAGLMVANDKDAFDKILAKMCRNLDTGRPAYNDKNVYLFVFNGRTESTPGIELKVDEVKRVTFRPTKDTLTVSVTTTFKPADQQRVDVRAWSPCSIVTVPKADLDLKANPKLKIELRQTARVEEVNIRGVSTPE